VGGLKIYYLAHPYSGDKRDNVKKSIKITNDLLDRGHTIFNPLTHSHPLDKEYKREPKFWYELDLMFLKKCDGIIMAPGWERSKGCRMELKEAENMIGKGINFEILFYGDPSLFNEFTEAITDVKVDCSRCGIRITPYWCYEQIRGDPS
jgi:hypothetical protein